MKLELKHLSPYIPYQPDVLHLERKMALTVTGIYKKHNRDEYFDILLLNWDLKLKSTEVKPILRPLSDLIKPIDQNNEFGKTRLEEINEELDSLIGDCTLTSDLCLIQNVSSDSEFMSYTYLDQMDKVLNILYKNHYDVHRLIDQGLAIDINTLDK